MTPSFGYKTRLFLLLQIKQVVLPWAESSQLHDLRAVIITTWSVSNMPAQIYTSLDLKEVLDIKKWNVMENRVGLKTKPVDLDMMICQARTIEVLPNSSPIKTARVSQSKDPRILAPRNFCKQRLDHVNSQVGNAPMPGH